MMRALALLVIVSMLPTGLCAAKMVTETYRGVNLDGVRAGRVQKIDDEVVEAPGTPSELEKFFMEFGVRFPAGSSIQYSRLRERLTVTNTPENMKRIEEILMQVSPTPSQVAVEVKLVLLTAHNGVEPDPRLALKGLGETLVF